MKNLFLLFLGVSILAISACPKKVDITAANQALVEHWLQLWNTGDLAIVEEIFASDFVNHDPSRPNVTDLESYEQWVESQLAGPLNVTVDDLIAEGDKVLTCPPKIGPDRERQICYSRRKK